MGKPTGFLEYERETGCVISPEERIQISYPSEQ